MATYTRDRAYHDILVQLGQIDADEPMPAADYQTVRDRYQQEIEFLYERGLIPFDLDTDAIPARFYTSIVAKVAYALMNDYSAFDRKDTLFKAAEDAETRLNQMRQKQQLQQTTSAEFF